MLYVITAHDKENSLLIRKETRPAHLDYLKSAGDRLKIGGPIMTSEGLEPAPCGSILILEAASEAAVKLFAENDPYAKAGLFETVTIVPWNGVVGNWIPK